MTELTLEPDSTGGESQKSTKFINYFGMLCSSFYKWI
jgi:hypothetical protein